MSSSTRRFWLRAAALALASPPLFEAASRAQESLVPRGNRASLTEPPARPGPGDVAERMERLLAACVLDEPARAQDAFLPRDAFRRIKAVADPDALYDRLLRAFDDDIHELHARLREETSGALETIAFVGFRFSGRRGWVRRGEEANRLPYWAQRHSWLDYRASGRDRTIEVRTMVAWDERWYVTHLNEFR